MTRDRDVSDRAALPIELRPNDWEEVEAAFRLWYGQNYFALEDGGTGDLVGLVFALRAAIAKA